MNIEALLKLRCQQALAQGDYDLVSSYSQQLSMFQQGTMLQDLPIIEELNELKYQHSVWLNGLEDIDMLKLFSDFYGEDLGSVCMDFFYEFGGAELYDVIWSSKQ